MLGSPFDFSEESAQTNEALADEIAALSPLSSEELNAILPEPIDRERFKALATIIQSSTNQQEQIASLQQNFSQVGGVVVKLLGKFINPLG
ncbi:MAG: hypothetical protein AAF564_08560 [Bacteroidota bacterium]